MRFNPSQRQKELLTSAFLIVLFLGGFLAAELALRISQILSFGTIDTVEQSDLFKKDPDTGLRRPVPGSVHGKIKYNQLGFRSPEITVEKPAHTLRIMFLGSSTTNDAYVTRLEDTWPHVATQKLAANLDDCNVEYINAGVPGLSSNWLTIYFENHLQKLSADIVVVLTNDQNAILNELAEKKGVFDGVHYQPSWLAEHSLFWGKVEKNARIISLQRSAHQEIGKLPIHEEELADIFQARLRKLVDVILGAGSLPVLVSVDSQIRKEQSKEEQIAAANTALFFMPYMSIKGLLASVEAQNDAIKHVAETTGAGYIDVSGIVPGNEQYYVDSAHFTANGSRVMGEYVGGALLSLSNVTTRLAASGIDCTLH